MSFLKNLSKKTKLLLGGALVLLGVVAAYFGAQSAGLLGVKHPLLQYLENLEQPSEDKYQVMELLPPAPLADFFNIKASGKKEGDSYLTYAEVNFPRLQIKDITSLSISLRIAAREKFTGDDTVVSELYFNGQMKPQSIGEAFLEGFLSGAFEKELSQMGPQASDMLVKYASQYLKEFFVTGKKWLYVNSSEIQKVGKSEKLNKFSAFADYSDSLEAVKELINDFPPIESYTEGDMEYVAVGLDVEALVEDMQDLYENGDLKEGAKDVVKEALDLLKEMKDDLTQEELELLRTKKVFEFGFKRLDGGKYMFAEFKIYLPKEFFEQDQEMQDDFNKSIMSLKQQGFTEFADALDNYVKTWKTDESVEIVTVKFSQEDRLNVAIPNRNSDNVVDFMDFVTQLMGGYGY